MTIPLPSLLLNRGVVKFGDFVFNIRIGTLSVFSVITAISFVVLLAQTYDLQKRYSMHSDPHLEVHYSADLQVCHLRQSDLMTDLLLNLQDALELYFGIWKF